ncbi:hypothetical protein [Streptomyces sp. NPDC086023]|uniref:hypothetical protein n=1 Tax=Streptomyces sp. NPDC086023 TaxID=3365746 RepID=UPI0037D8EA8D
MRTTVLLPLTVLAGCLALTSCTATTPSTRADAPATPVSAPATPVPAPAAAAPAARTTPRDAGHPPARTTLTKAPASHGRPLLTVAPTTGSRSYTLDELLAPGDLAVHFACEGQGRIEVSLGPRDDGAFGELPTDGPSVRPRDTGVGMTSVELCSPGQVTPRGDVMALSAPARLTGVTVTATPGVHWALTLSHGPATKPPTT